MSPRVSVIIPAFNHNRFIGQAIESVLNQNFSSLEIIVVDDGSIDETATAVQKYSHRICYIRQSHAGVSAARNRGLSLSHGEYIVFLDSDDIFLPHKLAQQVAYLDAHPTIGGVHSGWRLIDKDGRPLGEVKPWQVAPRLDLKTWLLWKPVLLGAMMLRRDWLERSTGFDPQLQQAEDVDLLWRLSLQGCRFDWLRRTTVGYRQHGKNSVLNSRQQAQNLNDLVEKFFQRPHLPRYIRRLENRVRYHTLLWIVWQLQQTGNKQEIVPYLRRARTCWDGNPTFVAQHWQAQLINHALASQSDLTALRHFWPYFQTALEVKSQSWQQILPSLDWWLEIWQPYLDQAYSTGASNLKRYRHLSPDSLTRLAQTCLVVSRQPATLRDIQQFWHDAQVNELVPLGSKAVTSLYLLLFGQAVLNRNWLTAGQALGQAIRVGWQPQAWPFWLYFLKASLLYVSGRLEKQPVVQQI